MKNNKLLVFLTTLVLLWCTQFKSTHGLWWFGKNSNTNKVTEIVDLIKSENFTSARDKFTKLENPLSEIATITNQLFDQEKPELALEFLNVVDSKDKPCQFYAAGLSAVIDKILSTKSFLDPEGYELPLAGGGYVLTLSRKFFKNCSAALISSDPILNATASKFNTKIEQLIEGWGKEIAKGHDYVALISDNNNMTKYFPRIVHAAYAGNKSNLVNTAQFIGRYVVTQWKSVGWQQLLSELENDSELGKYSEEMMQFTYWIVKDLEDSKANDKFNEENFGANAYKIYSDIENSLPEEFKQIFMGKSCIIQNVESKDFLSVLSKHNNESEVTLTSKPIQNANAGMWKLEPFIALRYKEGEEDTFLGGKLFVLRFAFKSVATGEEKPEYLCLQKENRTGIAISSDPNLYTGLCADANMKTEENSNWNMIPILTKNKEQIYFELIAGHPMEESYRLSVQSNNNKSVLVVEKNIQNVSTENTTQKNYLANAYWQIDCK